MFKNEIENERPDTAVIFFKNILEFNNQNQEGQGLKVLTPYHMLSRLTINLAPLKPGNNLQELKNKIDVVFFVSFKKIIENNL